jgi:hypothetical protein
MTTATKVSSCVGCGTPIIGDRSRCPACHDEHAALVVTSYQDDVTDDTVTAPRSRVHVVNRSSALVRWAVAIEVLGIVGLALVLLVKGCS